MKEKLRSILQKIIQKHYHIDIGSIELEYPPKKEVGDFAFGTFVLAKEIKKSPHIIAETLVELLLKEEYIQTAYARGPYINIKLANSIVTEAFLEYIKKFESDSLFLKKDETIFVDYIGANVGKPMHIGHMCTPNIGQTLINLYKKMGYNVVSDSHIGDWGVIFGKLITAYKLWGDEKKLHEDAISHLLELYIKITAEAEVDKGLEERTRKAFKELSNGDKESIELWALFTRYSIKSMQKDLDRLYIHPDYNIGESFYEGIDLPKLGDYPDLQHSMKDIVTELVNKNIATVNDDNSVGVEFDKNTKLPSCMLRKRDATHGYFASDLTAIRYRIDYWNPSKIIYSVDVRQSLHFRQAFQIAEAAGWLANGTELIHVSNGFIKLKDGAMSTRKGRIIKLDVLLDEAEKRAKDIIISKGSDIKGEELDILSKKIGIGAIKYGYLKKSRENDIVFDWDEFMTFEGNSGPYIQYSYVRVQRILQKFQEKYNSNNYSLGLGEVYFEHNEETELVKKLLIYKEVLCETGEKNMPHILCNYVYDLTKSFSNFYTQVHILNEDNEYKQYLRILLIDLFGKTLKDAFSILAIELPEKM